MASPITLDPAPATARSKLRLGVNPDSNVTNSSVPTLKYWRYSTSISRSNVWEKLYECARRSPAARDDRSQLSNRR